MSADARWFCANGSITTTRTHSARRSATASADTAVDAYTTMSRATWACFRSVWMSTRTAGRNPSSPIVVMYASRHPLGLASSGGTPICPTSAAFAGHCLDRPTGPVPRQRSSVTADGGGAGHSRSNSSSFFASPSGSPAA